MKKLKVFWNFKIIYQGMRDWVVCNVHYLITGMDSTRKYVLQNSNDQSLENMGYLVDTCSHLALLSNGSIFDSSSLSLTKVRHQKMAIDTISNRIAKSSLPSQCQVCTCEADETGAAKSVCRSCYSEMTDVSTFLFHKCKLNFSLSLSQGK